MGKRLPWVYALISILFFVGLTHRYATNPPTSSDPLSIGLGWVGLGAMIVMLAYSLARRFKGLRDFARLSYWLHLHIFLGVIGFIAVVFHSLHVFTRDAPISLLNPGFLNFIAVVIVFFSGIFGRYLYAQLPHSRGEYMLASEIDAEIERLGEVSDEVRALFAVSAEATSFIGLIKADLATRDAIRQLRGMHLDPEVEAVAERRLKLERRLVAWDVADSVFRRWIIFHRPLAGVLYVLSAVHIILSYMFTPALQ